MDVQLIVANLYPLLQSWWSPLVLEPNHSVRQRSSLGTNKLERTLTSASWFGSDGIERESAIIFVLGNHFDMAFAWSWIIEPMVW